MGYIRIQTKRFEIVLNVAAASGEFCLSTIWWGWCRMAGPVKPSTQWTTAKRWVLSADLSSLVFLSSWAPSAPGVACHVNESLWLLCNRYYNDHVRLSLLITWIFLARSARFWPQKLRTCDQDQDRGLLVLPGTSSSLYFSHNKGKIYFLSSVGSETREVLMDKMYSSMQIVLIFRIIKCFAASVKKRRPRRPLRGYHRLL